MKSLLSRAGRATNVVSPDMAVAIHLRVSTEEQRERQSIATQRDFASRYCDLHLLPVASIYTDDGISGTVPLERRQEGRRLLEDARSGKFRQLLIYKLDRLGRDTRLILNAVDELERSGTVAFEQYFSTDPTGSFKWPIHPEGFAPAELLELARLQGWTLKPACSASLALAQVRSSTSAGTSRTIGGRPRFLLRLPYSCSPI
jgi:hypothetical protein